MHFVPPSSLNFYDSSEFEVNKAPRIVVPIMIMTVKVTCSLIYLNSISPVLRFCQY